jgi:putative nucleotidyltransferase with HDIG domain
MTAETILFVDEERFVHKALKRSFRNMSREWDMRFVSSPQEALQAIDASPVDVIVTETVFSGQNGLDFLRWVRQNHPQTVRIILSGYSDRDIILKSVDLAHQYLDKPCEDEALKATISRAFLMKELLAQGTLKKVVSQIDSLPSLPALYVELMEELKSEDTSVEKVGRIIGKDIGLTAKVLKLVNSAFFCLPQHISNPAKAVSMLGIDIIQSIVLTSGTFDKYNHLKFHGFTLEQLWHHAMMVASFAKVIAKQAGMAPKDIETAFMAGLLHDIGVLLIASHLPQEFSNILKIKEKQSVPRVDAELAVVGTTHAAVGAYLLGLWGLPDEIIDAAAFHHTPSQKPFNGISSVVIVHAADALVHAGHAGVAPNTILDGLDYAFMESANLLDTLEDWRQSCADYLEPM